LLVAAVELLVAVALVDLEQVHHYQLLLEQNIQLPLVLVEPQMQPEGVQQQTAAIPRLVA
jgi:hypothetical protein